MAVLGSATIVVRAITTNVGSDIRRSLEGAEVAASKAGRSMGTSFTRNFQNASGNPFSRLIQSLQGMEGELVAARQRLLSLIRVSNFAGPAIAGLVGAIGALGGALTTLVGVLATALPALAALGGAFVTLGAAAIGARIGLGGVFSAVAQANEQNREFAGTLRDINEEMQQLKFSAEDAALSEERAALNLEKARENLIRMQDLPPNSRARREAELAYEEAELAFRRAKDQNSDLQKQLEDGVTPADVGGVQDPFAGLNDSQRALAEYLVSLQGLFDELEEKISDGFVPGLMKGLKKLETEVLRQDEFGEAVEAFGESLGMAAENFFNAILDNGGAESLTTLINQFSEDIPQIGTILGNVFSIFLEILIAAEPLIDRFLGSMEDSTGNILSDLRKANSEEGGGLTEFFETAGDRAAQLGTILGNIIQGIFGIGEAAEEGGAADTLLGYLEEITERFSKIGDDEKFAENLNLATENGTKLLDLIGNILGGIFELGASPELGEFLDELNSEEFQENFSEFMDKMIGALPELGEFLTELITFMNNITDEGGMEAFFTTLTTALEGINGVIGSDTGQKILGVVSPIFQTLNAIGLIFTLITNFVLLPLGGFLLGIFAPMAMALGFKIGPKGGFIKTGGGIFGFFDKTLPRLFGKTDKGAKVTGGKLGSIFKIGGGAATGGRLGAVGGAPGIALGFLIGSLADVSGLTDIAADSLNGFFGEIGRNVEESTGKLTKWLDDGAPGLEEKWDGLTENLGGAWDTFTGNLGEGFELTMDNAFGSNAIPNAFIDLVNGLLDLWEGFVNNLITALNNGIIKGINSISIPIPEGIRAFIAGVNYIRGENNVIPKSLGFQPLSEIGEYRIQRIPRLAQGGIVAPTLGGQIVNVAEAGQPERVEPLDAQGLSKRDRVLIDTLKETGRRGDVNVTVNGSPGMDVKELAEEVSRRIAFQVRKGTF